jgi:kynureninase
MRNGMTGSHQRAPSFIIFPSYINVLYTLRFVGWWGHDPLTRFTAPSFFPIPGAQGFQQSNPCVLATVSLLGSLQIFKEAGMMGPLRKRSISLTGDLERWLLRSKYFVSPSDVSSFSQSEAAKSGKARFTIITPSCSDRRGSQLSLLILPLGSGAASKVFEGLLSYGVIGDERKPDLIRLTPCPLYNTFSDCKNAALRVEHVLDALNIG